MGVVIPGGEAAEGYHGQLMKSGGGGGKECNGILSEKNEKAQQATVVRRSNCVSGELRGCGRDVEDVKYSEIETSTRVRQCLFNVLGKCSGANFGVDGALRDLCAAKHSADLYTTGRVALSSGGGDGGGGASDSYDGISRQLLTANFAKSMGPSSNLRSISYNNFVLPSDFRKCRGSSSHVANNSCAEGVKSSLKDEGKRYHPSSRVNDGSVSTPYVYPPISSSPAILPNMESSNLFPPSTIPKSAAAAMASAVITSMADMKSGKLVSPQRAYSPDVPFESNGGGLNLASPYVRSMPSPKTESGATTAVPTTKASEQQPNVEKGRKQHIPFVPNGRGLTVPFLPSSYGERTMAVKRKHKDTHCIPFLDRRRSINGHRQTLSTHEEDLNNRKNLINAGILASVLEHSNVFPGTGTTTSASPHSSTGTSSSSSSSSTDVVHHENGPCACSPGSTKEFKNNSEPTGQNFVRKANGNSPVSVKKKEGGGSAVHTRSAKPSKELQSRIREMQKKMRAQVFNRVAGRYGGHKFLRSCSPNCKDQAAGLSSSSEEKKNEVVNGVRLEEAYLLLSVSQGQRSAKKETTQNSQESSPSPPPKAKNCGVGNVDSPLFNKVSCCFKSLLYICVICQLTTARPSACPLMLR